MFAMANVKSWKGVTRKAIYSLMTRIDKSQNPSIQNIAISDVEIVYSVYCILVYILHLLILFIYLFYLDIRLIV